MKAFYLRDKQRRPVALVGTELIDDGGNDSIHFAVATWNPADIYDRNRAYEIVAGRLEVGRSIPLKLGKHIKHEILKHIVNNYQPGEFYDELASPDHLKYYPERTREAAALWMKEHPITE